MNAAQITEQLLTASTAFAGLILVFLGNIVAAYESYMPEHRRAVLPIFRSRAWLAFAGFTASLLSALLALANNWADCDVLVYASVGFLLVALGCTLYAAFREVWGIS